MARTLRIMTPYRKLLWAVLVDAAESYGFILPATVDETNVEALYAELCERDIHWDCVRELRESGIETGLEGPASRHYESKEVAAKMPDGSWVGWTYWHGGGKHGNPESIPWMPDAYDVTMEEKEELVLVKHWSKKEDNQ